MSNENLEPQGVPTGGDALSADEPTANDGTAGTDAVAGDAGSTEGDSLADTADAGEVDPDDEPLSQ